MRIGEALLLIRKYQGLRQNAVADHVKMSTSYLSEIERGTKMPTIQVIAQLAEAYEMESSAVMLFAEALDDPTAVERFPVPKVVAMMEIARLCG